MAAITNTFPSKYYTNSTVSAGGGWSLVLTYDGGQNHQPEDKRGQNHYQQIKVLKLTVNFKANRKSRLIVLSVCLFIIPAIEGKDHFSIVLDLRLTQGYFVFFDNTFTNSHLTLSE